MATGRNLDHVCYGGAAWTCSQSQSGNTFTFVVLTDETGLIELV